MGLPSVLAPVREQNVSLETLLTIFLSEVKKKKKKFLLNTLKNLFLLAEKTHYLINTVMPWRKLDPDTERLLV